MLGVVAERVSLPDDIVATLDGKSSLGRLGLVVHQTAGVVDAGFDGHITLELANVANLPITVYPGMRIAQLSFMALTTPADNPYGSGALGVKVSGRQGRAHPQPLPPQLRTAAMKVLVTGASGYVGTRLADRFERDGHEVVRFSRHTGGDITDAEAVAKAVAGVDAIAHLVAILDGSDEQFQAVNVGGTRNVLDAARAAGVKRFLHMSALGVTPSTRPRRATGAPSGRRFRP